jgi:hypothetical protein
MSKVTGSCLCSAIRYEIEGEPMRMANCHCDDCRKATGAPYTTNVFYKDTQITLLKGTPKVFEHTSDSGNSMAKEFCGDCGSQIFGTGALRPGIRHVKVGTIDDASFVKPEANLFVPHALSYTHLDEDIPGFEKMPT